jgi:hypothetical protein
MIVKSFVALGFVIKVDDMFSENFPTTIKKTSAEMVLVIGKDQNTYKKIMERVSKAQKKGRPLPYFSTIFNLFINIWYTFLNTFYIVIYYYFMPITCVISQFTAFYY